VDGFVIARGSMVTVSLTLISGCFGQKSHIDLGPVPAGVTVDARLQYYDVTAASLTDLRRGMIQLGPRWEGRSYQAVTQSRFRWGYVVESARGPVDSASSVLCQPRKVRVTVQTVVVFPRWNPSAEPDSAMLEWWHQLNAGLMEHERGHARLSVKTAGDIAKSLEAMAPVPCDDLARQVSSAGQQRIIVERRQQVEYDRSTRHGATQIEQASRLRSP
jgi:predicted secreted Zn-dependent protease